MHQETHGIKVNVIPIAVAGNIPTLYGSELSEANPRVKYKRRSLCSVTPDALDFLNRS